MNQEGTQPATIEAGTDVPSHLIAFVADAIEEIEGTEAGYEANAGRARDLLSSEEVMSAAGIYAAELSEWEDLVAVVRRALPGGTGQPVRRAFPGYDQAEQEADTWGRDTGQDIAVLRDHEHDDYVIMPRMDAVIYAGFHDAEMLYCASFDPRHTPGSPAAAMTALDQRVRTAREQVRSPQPTEEKPFPPALVVRMYHELRNATSGLLGLIDSCTGPDGEIDAPGVATHVRREQLVTAVDAQLTRAWSTGCNVKLGWATPPGTFPELTGSILAAVDTYVEAAVTERTRKDERR